MPVTIEEFYKNNTVDPEFDAEFYETAYPATIAFYQPYCAEHKITNKARLFYHYALYGFDAGYRKHAADAKRKPVLKQKTELRVRGYTADELLALLNVDPVS